MFDQTQAVANKIVSDLKKFSFVISLIAQLFFIAYDIYAVFARSGILVVNIVLASLAVCYFVFYIVMYVKGGKTKAVKKKVGFFYRLLKYAIHAVTLGFALYDIYSSKVGDFITVLLTALSAIGFLLQIITEAIRQVVSRYTKLIKTAITADTEFLRKLQNPRKAIMGTVNKPIGALARRFAAKMNEGEELPEEKEEKKDNIVRKVEEIAAAYAEERAKKNEEKKLEKKEERRALAEEMKENFRLIGQGIKYTLRRGKPKKEEVPALPQGEESKGKEENSNKLPPA